MNENFTEEDIHMANKHMIRCSTLAIREIQFKTTMRYHYTPIRLAKINHTDNTKCWQVSRDVGSLTISDKTVNCTSTLENTLAVF